jgi:hypothetical protein
MVVAVVPLNVTVLDPCGLPKLDPPIVTDVPTVVGLGEALVMTGAGVLTVNVQLLE